jgi:hypothetical protein
MNILDENIDDPQRQQLADWKIRFRQIGFEIGRAGMKDQNDVFPLLHSLRRPTFFTRDRDFFHPDLRHHNYCLVYLDVWADETAEYIRRFLRHKTFRTQAQRMGKVVRVRHSGISFWQVKLEAERALSW